MAQARKVISILVDGVSADYFLAHPAKVPNLTRFARQGLFVGRLQAGVPATSMPGRAGLLTGVAADCHGIYGNYVLDGHEFRTAGSEDVRVPTIAARATAAGRDVVSISHGLVDPKDAAVHVPAWWLRGFINSATYTKTVPTEDIRKSREIKDPQGRLRAAGIEQIYGFPGAEGALPSPGLVAGMASDLRMLDAAAALACSDLPPDLILTEIDQTDGLQHDFGYESEAAHWGIAIADMMIGALVQRLERAPSRPDYCILITSDHGHGKIHTSLFPDIILPGATWAAEGATCHVLVSNADARNRALAAFEEHGAQMMQSDHVPRELRDRILTFIAPAECDFEQSLPERNPSGHPTGRAQYASTHGFRPGSPADDRFLIVIGKSIAPVTINRATDDRIAPTMADLLGLPLDGFPGRSLLDAELAPA